MDFEKWHGMCYNLCHNSFGGAVAQLGEHHVRNVGAVGSNPICSTTFLFLSDQSGTVPSRGNINMEEYSCPHCGYAFYDDGARACLHCGGDLERDHGVTDRMRHSTQWWSIAFVVILIVGVFLFLLVEAIIASF